MTYPGEKRAWTALGLPSGSWKRFGEAHQSPYSYQIMLNIKRLDCVTTNTQILYTMQMTGIPSASLLYRKATQATFPWPYPQEAGRWAMQEIRPFCTNTWQKETREADDKIYILHTETAGDTGTLRAQKRSKVGYNSLLSDWRQIVVACSDDD